jgi:UDPglucose 6-dehydrogenase
MIKKSIVVLGLWHQGIVAAACLADWGYDVLGLDQDEGKISKLNDGESPIFEPNLDDLLKKGLANKNLFFEAFNKGAFRSISAANYILIAHDTPVNDSDESDLSEVLKSVKDISNYLPQNILIHVSAQVPVGTCHKIEEIIKSTNPNLKFFLTYSPENLRLGEAIVRYKNPPLPVVGADNDEAFNIFECLFERCNVKWHRSDLLTAEMTKHSLNAFLATCVTFANEVGNLCDEVGANAHKIAEFLRLEPRVGSKAMLFPGLGFSGGTLARDIQTLRILGDKSLVETKLFDAIWQVNQNQNNSVVYKLKKYFGGSLKSKRICILGLTYKADTSTLRRSASLEIITSLKKEGAKISAHDPVVKEEDLKKEENFSFKNFHFFNFVDDAIKDADAIVLMTPWHHYKNLNFDGIKKSMIGNLVFDTSKFWNEDEIQSFGFKYISIGSGKIFKVSL